MVPVATFQGTRWWEYTQLKTGSTLLAYQIRAKQPSPKAVFAHPSTVSSLTPSTVMFFKAMPVMPLTKARSQRSMASVLHSLVLVSQMAWPTRTNVALSATRCKLRSALVKWLAARKFMQQMIHQHHLIPYSILVKDPPYVHYAVPRQHIDDRESLIWHTTPGAFVFQPAFIVASFLCLLLNTLPLNSFLDSPHLYSVITQVLTPSFDLRFITQLFNRTPSHTICLSLCSYSAQSQSRLGLKRAREIDNYRL